jgi:hypothetical protein
MVPMAQSRSTMRCSNSARNSRNLACLTSFFVRWRTIDSYLYVQASQNLAGNLYGRTPVSTYLRPESRVARGPCGISWTSTLATLVLPTPNGPLINKIKFGFKVKTSHLFGHTFAEERGSSTLSPHLPECPPRELAPATGLVPRRLPRLLRARPSAALDERHGPLLGPVTGQLQHNNPGISIRRVYLAGAVRL